MRTRRPVQAATLAALLALSLAGCLKMDMDLTLQPDDTVDGSLLLALDAEAAEMSGQDPATLAEEMRTELLDSEDGPQNATVETYDDGEYVGTTMTFEGEALDVFGEAGDPESLSIVREGDEFVVTGLMDLTETTEESLSGFSDSLDLRIAVTFPGEVTEHDGDLDGTTVQWRPAPGERVEMNARGDATGTQGAGGLGLIPLIALGLLAVVVVGLLIFLMTRGRRRRPGPDVTPADMGAAYGAPGGYTGPQPDPAAPAQGATGTPTHGQTYAAPPQDPTQPPDPTEPPQDPRQPPQHGPTSPPEPGPEAGPPAPPQR